MKGSSAKRESVSIGLISDTHGLLRPGVLRLFAGVDLILHAGDVGKPEVLQGLETLAPVCAVRGNNDHGGWAEALPASRTVEAAGARLFVLHDLQELDIDPAHEGCAAVISGHSHKPLLVQDGGVLFLNPGSAGPRRFTLPVSCARIDVRAGKVSARLLEIPEMR